MGVNGAHPIKTSSYSVTNILNESYTFPVNPHRSLHDYQSRVKDLKTLQVLSVNDKYLLICFITRSILFPYHVAVLSTIQNSPKKKKI